MRINHTVSSTLLLTIVSRCRLPSLYMITKCRQAIMGIILLWGRLVGAMRLNLHTCRLGYNETLERTLVWLTCLWWFCHNNNSGHETHFNAKCKWSLRTYAHYGPRTAESINKFANQCNVDFFLFDLPKIVQIYICILIAIMTKLFAKNLRTSDLHPAAFVTRVIWH